MAFRAKNKKKTSSRFSQVAFQSRVRHASAYRRNGQGWKRDVQVLRAFFSRVRVWPFVAVGVVITLLGVLIYHPALFHIRRIVVTGLPPAWAQEVQSQSERYVADSRFLFLPGKNLLFVDTKGLAAYVTAVNTHVQSVETVLRRWPHGLEIRAVPRVPAYAWTDAPTQQSVLISNDGKVLPENERGSSALLSLRGSRLATKEMGGQAIGGALLQALEVVRTQFSQRTGLTSLAAVELVPLVSTTAVPTAQSLASSAVEDLLVPAVTHELRVELLPDAAYATPAFVVYLDVSSSVTDALDRLRVLLERQPAERRAELYYVDLRFPARAYVCVRSASCAAPVRDEVSVGDSSAEQKEK